jgi:hypothetical protein
VPDYAPRWFAPPAAVATDGASATVSDVDVCAATVTPVVEPLNSTVDCAL